MKSKHSFKMTNYLSDDLVALFKIFVLYHVKYLPKEITSSELYWKYRAYDTQAFSHVFQYPLKNKHVYYQFDNQGKSDVSCNLELNKMPHFLRININDGTCYVEEYT